MQYFNKNRYSNNTIIVIQNILQITYTMRKKDSTDDPTTLYQHCIYQYFNDLKRYKNTKIILTVI